MTLRHNPIVRLIKFKSYMSLGISSGFLTGKLIDFEGFNPCPYDIQPFTFL
jgi:hypothetical protein